VSGVEATLFEPGEGEAISKRPERSVWIKAGREELVLTESRYGPGESGPAAHIHREHADCFWILDGELTFELANERVRAPGGGFVLVPPEVVHTFRNEGPGHASFLNIHAPGKGFDGHLRALRDAGSSEVEEAAAERFDTFDPPAGGGRRALDALVRRPGDGEVLSVGPSQIAFKAGREHGMGSLSLTDTTVAPGFPGPVPHYHETFVDSFWVLDGTLTLLLGDQTLHATAGTYALVPPRVVHTFSNPGEEPVRLLNLMAPGGFEQYLKEVAARAPPGGQPDQGLMAEIASRHDFHPAV
jgi:mannose-6-phosphate isomerase-like protein (cupin superfamily)